MSGKSIRQQFADTMVEVGQRDQELVVVVGDISHFALQPYAERCPGRYFNIGICESAMTSVGAGLAKLGLIPVLHTIAPFLLERSFEQIKLDFGYHKLGGNFVTVGSAFDYANLGCTHHCYGDFALLKLVEGSQIFFPASPTEFDALFKAAYRSQTVNLFRIPSRSHGIEIAASEIQVGKALRLREGNEVTLVATGPQLANALQAAERLETEKISAEVIYVHSIRPLDTGLLRDSLQRTRHVVVVEEHMQSGGLGDDILRLTREDPQIRFASVSIPDRFVREYGTYDEHCASLGLSPEGIHRAARELVIKSLR